MTELSLDFETFCELDLKTVGSSRYARDSSTEGLLLGWAIDDDDVEVVRFAEGEKAPRILKDALRDPEVIKCAWNAPFEMQILMHVFGIKVYPDEWQDTMVLAHALSFPGKLEHAGPAMGIPGDKQKDARGKALIRKFCKPRKPTKKQPWLRATYETDPEDWEEFVEYCRQDVISERFIRNKLTRWGMSDEEWRYWHMDWDINQAGIPINQRVVSNAIRTAKYVIDNRMEEMRDITGLQNPNSGKQLLPWLKDRGYRFDDLKKGHVKKALDDLCQDEVDAMENRDVLRVLELRQEVSKTSVKKYNALKHAADEDGVLRNAFQYKGAQRTGRFAGRKYQAQNLAKPVKYLEDCLDDAVDHLEKLPPEILEIIYTKPMDLLSSCVRPVVQAQPGHLFCDADLNAIENRVLGWVADDQKILDVFRCGRDPYVDFAKYMTGRTYEDLWHEYKVEGKKENRTIAKPGVLGCGYMLGAGEQKENKKTGEIEATGLLGYGWNMGVMLTPQQSAHAVKVFRDTFTEVVDFWYAMDRAARKCIRTKKSQRVGFIEFDISGPFMRMILPSGRPLYYYKPQIRPHRTPWGEMKDTITYEGLNDKKKWTRIATHPGKLTENAVQAIALDILLHGMYLAKYKHGLDIRLHVHDQVVTMEREDLAEDKLKILIQCMSTVPKWAPGLILAAEGNVCRVFQKD